MTAFTLASGLGRLVASWAAERARRCRTHTALLTATTLRQSTPAATAPHGPLTLLIRRAGDGRGHERLPPAESCHP
ncbi:hypothetical protein [Nocardiopsis sp. B62]|uniref:hypothetical protein n=1 Tax=Nocardiopsis sp. B62 TaxID=2824874 RepID=UPI001B35DB59|nr:hypothetical protein [Nocardiopsis sp. B62]MBQ1081180.1 hypothetical protein [Nocardiopsis sp. B62]